MSKFLAILVGALLFVSLLLFFMTYTVSFHEVAVRSRMGKASADSVITDAGLKFNIPFIDQVTTFDTRLQLRESPVEHVQTADGQQVVVKAFLMWRVDTTSKEGPLKFLRRHASVEAANDALSTKLLTALKTGVSRYSFNELIGENNKLADAEATIKAELASLKGEEGIEPVTVGISQLVLPPKTVEAVLSRMQATRKTISDNERSEGEAEARRIRSEASSVAERIKAFADARAQEIKSAGNVDAEEAMTKMAEDEGLAILLAWMDTLRTTMMSNLTIVLPTNLEPFHMFTPDLKAQKGGVPMPDGSVMLPTKPRETEVADVTGEAETASEKEQASAGGGGS